MSVDMKGNENLKNSYNRRRRRTVKVNGVRILNVRNAVKPQKNNPDVPFNDKNLVWLADKDNLEL